MRIAVVGCGKIAERHLAAYRAIDGVEVTVTDIVERGRSVAQRHGAGWSPAPAELIAGDAIDAIDVCTPTPSHAQFIFDGLDAGKHVFCEKPLARSTGEAAMVEARAALSDRVVMVGYLYRFHPAFRFVRDLLRDGVLGDVHFATLRLGGRGSHKAWKHRRETGGGAGNEMLVHMLDLALWYFGEPEEVTNLWTETLLPGREIEGARVDADAEDVVLLRLRTATGAAVLVQSDLVTPGYMNHVEVHGSNGSVFTSILEHLPTTLFCREPRHGHPAGETVLRFPREDLFERELRHFVDVCRGAEEERTNSVAESVRLMQVVESVLPAVER
jgi:predicted dehydrogenase